MSSLSGLNVPLDLLKPPPAATLQSSTSLASVSTAGADARRTAIKQSAQAFESSFLSSMLGEMFKGVSTDGEFDGGEGEAMFRSFMTDAMGKQIAKAGGVGVAASVQREMLKLQGLS